MKKINWTIPVSLAAIACLAQFIYTLRAEQSSVFTLVYGVAFAVLLCIAATLLIIDKFVYTGKLTDIAVDVQERAVDLRNWTYHREKAGYIIDAYTAKEPLNIVNMPVNINGIPVIFVPPMVILHDYLPTMVPAIPAETAGPADISSVVKEGASPSLEIGATA